MALSGPEMLLKAMGIDAKQIEAVVTEIVKGIRDNNERMKRMEEKLERIYAVVNPPSEPHYGQPQLEFQEEKENA